MIERRNVTVLSGQVSGSIVIAFVFAFAMQGAPLAQKAAPSIQPVQRSSASVKVAGKDVRVAIDTWIIPNASKIDALALPLRGKTIVEVRAGHLITVIDGARSPRRAGDFWTVASGAALRLETGNDSAIIQTTVVAD